MMVEQVFLITELERLKTLAEIDCKHKTIFEAFASLGSEVGELGQELLTEEGSFGNTHREVDEGSQIESVDVMICAMHIYFASGGTIENLHTIMGKKLTKWESCQTKSSTKSSTEVTTE